VAETVSALDNTAASVDFVASVAESVEVEDIAPDTGFDFSVTVPESAQMTDTLLTEFTYLLFIAESASTAENVTPQTDFVASIVEAAQLAEENAVAASVFSANIVETVTVNDPLSARFLWEEVDDSETTDWVLVDDSQAVVWTEVDDSETTNWQPVVTTLP
jgi:hypothetical protein